MNILEHSYIITGPTASGKTNLAIKIAKQLDSEIICMDSMTLFKGMDIGTAKPNKSQQEEVKHHMLDVLCPTESSNVKSWLTSSKKIATNLIEKGKSPVFVGGTPFYLKALLLGLFKMPEIPKQIRIDLEAKFPQENFSEAHSFLMQVDPFSAKKIHPNDRRRIIRALEVWFALGKTISSLQKQWDLNSNSAFDPVKIKCIWLQIPRPQLHQRIHLRTANLLQNGWVEETKALRLKHPILGKEASQAIGYSQILNYLDGGIPYQEMEEKINIETRQFAKRQETWFRHLPGCTPVCLEKNLSLWGIPID